MSRDHLVIGDPHSKPGVSNERFIWAGKLAVERQTPVIVCMGDFADMPSLCSYDIGKKDFEGRRYQNDIAAANDALEKFNQPIVEYNKQAKRNKKAQYKPKKYMLGGNHDEGRMNKNFGISFFFVDKIVGTKLKKIDGFNEKGYKAALERYNYLFTDE